MPGPVLGRARAHARQCKQASTLSVGNYDAHPGCTTEGAREERLAQEGSPHNEDGLAFGRREQAGATSRTRAAAPTRKACQLGGRRVPRREWEVRVSASFVDGFAFGKKHPPKRKILFLEPAGFCGPSRQRRPGRFCARVSVSNFFRKRRRGNTNAPIQSRWSIYFPTKNHSSKIDIHFNQMTVNFRTYPNHQNGCLFSKMENG